jgi:hypothetical protein
MITTEAVVAELPKEENEPAPGMVGRKGRFNKPCEMALRPWRSGPRRLLSVLALAGVCPSAPRRRPV